MAEPPIILIVDESPTNRAALYDLLASRNYRVLVAENGDAAVEITALVTPTVVLLDTDLPGMDGFETCRQIISQPHGKDIHILFISNQNNSESRAESFKAGGQAYLLKPLIYDELYSLVETCLKLAEYKQATDSQDHIQKQSQFEMDSIIDMVAHDINTPLVGILGFIEEYAEEFEEADNIPEHWIEYLSIFKKCSVEIDVIVKALVLLKNLRIRESGEPEETSLSELITNVSSRYENLEAVLPLKLEHTLKVDSILSDPTLLEELLLMIWQTLGNLNTEKGDALSLRIDSLKDDHGRIQLSISAKTREISEEELPRILKPMSGGKRQKVKDTNMLTICIQRLIESLAINAWAERIEGGLRIHLSFATD
ncbi:MAG: CheY-like chemotaxis protein [Lentimonas sp.]|jgi:CheY-like chemotaxis protein